MWWLWSVVWAGTPVLHDGGDASTVLDAVSGRSGLPTDQLEALSLDTALSAPPAVLGNAVLRRCTRALSAADAVRTDVARAEAALAQGDAVGTRDHLDLAVARLGCLSELPEPAVAARVFWLRTLLEAESQPEVARGELRTALAFAPSLVADPDTPEVVAAWLETQRAEPAAVTLSLFPAQSPSGPWIDGLAVTESARSLRPGLHLAQYAGPRGVASAWLLVDGQASLVLPASYRRPVLQSITDPATRDGVEALVAAATPDAHAVYVTVNGGLWLLTPEGGEWMTTEIAPALGEPVEPPSTGGGNNKNKNKNKNKGGDR